MKVRSTSTQEFKPFDLVINIETRREAEFLWAFFNASKARMVDFANKNIADVNIVDFKIEETNFDTYELWDSVNKSIKVDKM